MPEVTAGGARQPKSVPPPPLLPASSGLTLPTALLASLGDPPPAAVTRSAGPRYVEVGSRKKRSQARAGSGDAGAGVGGVSDVSDAGAARHASSGVAMAGRSSGSGDDGSGGGVAGGGAAGGGSAGGGAAGGGSADSSISSPPLPPAVDRRSARTDADARSSLWSGAAVGARGSAVGEARREPPEEEPHAQV